MLNTTGSIKECDDVLKTVQYALFSMQPNHSALAHYNIQTLDVSTDLSAIQKLCGSYRCKVKFVWIKGMDQLHMIQQCI